jgi:hypothetical protein
MQIHKITLTIIDFDELGGKECVKVLENARYSNHCISPDVQSIETREIGQWHDGHLLNCEDTQKEEIDRLFS